MATFKRVGIPRLSAVCVTGGPGHRKVNGLSSEMAQGDGSSGQPDHAFTRSGGAHVGHAVICPE